MRLDSGVQILARHNIHSSPEQTHHGSAQVIHSESLSSRTTRGELLADVRQKATYTHQEQLRLWQSFEKFRPDNADLFHAQIKKNSCSWSLATQPSPSTLPNFSTTSSSSASSPWPGTTN